MRVSEGQDKLCGGTIPVRVHQECGPGSASLAVVDFLASETAAQDSHGADLEAGQGASVRHEGSCCLPSTPNAPNNERFNTNSALVAGGRPSPFRMNWPPTSLPALER